MTLTERIARGERREAALTPIVERRGGTERRIPEWRRRALEQIEQAGGRNLAVTDTTGRAA